MVGECREYLRTFDAFVRSWWSDTYGQTGEGGPTDFTRRTQLAVEQLEAETRGPAILEAHRRTIRRISELALSTLEGIPAIWRRQMAQADLLRARIVCAADFRDARMFVRELDLHYFYDECVVPFQLNGWPFGWHWDATRPDPNG